MLTYFIIAFFLLCGSTAFVSAKSVPATEERPNILWLTCEDIGRHLGCYDYPNAVSPSLDKLASRGTRYRHAWSNYPVCAPARTTIISGCYAAALGAEQMRSLVPIPESVRFLPWHLRQGGYYCSNNVKEDFNAFAPDVKNWWDACSTKAHWKNRPDGKPFFAVFNSTVTHESQIRNEKPHSRDLLKERVPKYHPDHPDVRRDWAQYHYNISCMDTVFGKMLDELEASGEAGNTVIFFFGDHGSGMPRNKRTPLDSGLGVPMIVYYPPKFRHLAPPDYKEGEFNDRLVSFVDLAPTTLSLAGIKPPANMQGIAFAGKYAEKPREYVFGFRGRMDERADLVRTIYDGRYVYVRNFHPEIICGAVVQTMFKTRTTEVWREGYDKGTLNDSQRFFWTLKPTEELYDLQEDPDEVCNLAERSEHRERIEKFRTVLTGHLLTIRDVHFLPENMMHERSRMSTPYQFAQDRSAYPLETILDAALRSTNRQTPNNELVRFLEHKDGAVRYWGAIGVLVRLADLSGPDGTQPTDTTTRQMVQWYSIIRPLLQDDEPAVQIVAAEIIGRYGTNDDVIAAVETLLPLAANESPYTNWLTLHALDMFAGRIKTKAQQDKIRRISGDNFSGRIDTVFEKLMSSIRQQLPKK